MTAEWVDARGAVISPRLRRGRFLDVSGRQLFEQRLRLLQIERVKPFSEPAVNRSEQFARLLHLALGTQPIALAQFFY